MKLLCEATVQHRQGGTTKYAGRSQKCTLALGQKSSSNQPHLFLLLFTPNDKTGIRYKVTDNLQKVFVKFVEHGKATVSLKEPAVDLHIRSETVPLKCFLRSLKLGLEGKFVPKLGTFGVTSASATAPPTKLVVKARGDYPLKGLPKTLTSLQVNGIQRCRFDSQILFLKHLTVLDLSDNAISVIPKQLGQMRLKSLNMGSNNLGSSETDWKWMQGTPLRGSLAHLDLTNNQLQIFPIGLVRFSALVTLKLDQNQLTRIPFAIRRMRQLRFLHLSSNQLQTLPQTIDLIYLKQLDLSANPLAISGSQKQSYVRIKPMVSQLWELAGRAVATHSIGYSERTLPRFLCDMLEEVPLCPCGAICFSGQMYEKSRMLTLHIEHITRDRIGKVMCDSVYCSERCFWKYATDMFGRRISTTQILLSMLA